MITDNGFGDVAMLFRKALHILGNPRVRTLRNEIVNRESLNRALVLAGFRLIVLSDAAPSEAQALVAIGQDAGRRPDEICNRCLNAATCRWRFRVTALCGQNYPEAIALKKT